MSESNQMPVATYDVSSTAPECPFQISSSDGSIAIALVFWSRCRAEQSRRTGSGRELILVTNDRVFRRIKKLKVEDWTKPKLRFRHRG